MTFARASRSPPASWRAGVSLLFDQNLSRRLPAMLAAEFPGSEHALLAGLDAADNQTVRAYAVAHGLTVVSKDSDFAQLSAFNGPPRKVVWLRLGNGPTEAVEALLRVRAADIYTFHADQAAAILELP